MRLKQQISARLVCGAAAALVLGLFASDRQVFASEQQPPAPATAPQPAATGPQISLTADEAVRLAIENNMGLQTERLSPQIQALALSQARAVYAPTLFSNFSRSANTSPPTDFLSLGENVFTVTSGSMRTDAGVQQQMRWGGGSYQVGMSGSRATSDAPRVPFSPQLNSSLTANYTQPLLRNFKIDGFRRALLQSRNQLEVSELQLAARITQTARNVRIGYYNLVLAVGQLAVARQSLDLAREALRQNERRVEIGTIAQIEILEAQAEVSRQEESVIITEANIRAAEDNLRTLVLNPSQPDFWTTRIVATDQPTVTPQTVDVEAAVANALKNRTDLAQIRKQLESADIDIRFAENQRLPALNLIAQYGASGIGGVQRRWGGGIDEQPFIIPGSETRRTLADALRDVFANDFKSWSVAVNFSYPIGTSPAEASLAQGRIIRQRGALDLREQEMSVVAQVREAGRQVNNTQQRVEATRKAREFAERRYEAEQKRVTVGLSATFQLFQAQRDLDNARQSELRAIIDYNRALVNFEAVQVAPLAGG